MPTKKTTVTKTTTDNIWKTLSVIDVNKHTKAKGTGRKDRNCKEIALTYLPWAHAVAYVKEHYPNMRYMFDSFVDNNGNRQFVNMVPHTKGWTGIVGCTVEIDDHTQHMVLPVMNNGMQATLNPTSKDVTDSLMRCLVKCLAMFGLGHYLYTGDSLPNEYEDVRGPLVRPVTTKTATIDTTKIKPITNNDGTPINPNQTTPTIS